MADKESEGIKSAFEKAMEKVQDLEPPSKEKMLEWKGVPKGTHLAAEHLRGQGDLAAGMEGHDPEERPYVLRGIIDVLVNNIQLPRTDVAQQSTEKALEGLKSVLHGKPQIEEIAGRVQYVSEQYKSHGQGQQQQLFEQLKEQFTAQLQQAIQQQTGAVRDVPVNIESIPEFQQEWRRMKAQMEQQYEQHLEAYREEIKALA